MKTFNHSINLHKANPAGIFLVLLGLLLSSPAGAQPKPMNAGYFFNEYLMNPAMAGRDRFVNANLGYRRQFNLISGAPQTAYLAFDYGFTANSGFGVKLVNDKAGLLRETSVALTYAYHLPLDDEKRLRFGLAGSITGYGLDNARLQGDADDPDALDVNDRKGRFDTDFGVTYSSPTLQVQAVFPNMLTLAGGDRENAVNYALFFSSVSYLLYLDLWTVEPKVIYRGIKGYDAIVDAGANITLNPRTKNKVSVQGLYHSSGNVTVAFGVNHDNSIQFNVGYNMGTARVGNRRLSDVETSIGIRF